jgi:hypothetical protein
MDMEAVKAALQDLLAAMDSEDKRVLKDRLAGPVEAPKVEIEAEETGPCPDCGQEPCTCAKGEEE